MESKQTYQNLCDRFKELDRLQHAITYLSWDQMVMMPANGAQSRSESIAELAGISHNKLTSIEVQDWLSELESQSDFQDESEQAVSLREMKRVWRNANCLPEQLVKEQIMVGSKCEMGWRTQRADNDWNGFVKNFRPVVELSRQEAKLRQSAGDASTPYEAMLALHCHGDSELMIESIFTKLREVLPDLLQRVLDGQGPVPQSEKAEYPVDQQLQLNKAMLVALGIDFESGRLDQSMHPFSTGSAGDSRITTRYNSNYFLEALAGTAHEAGHASYEGSLLEKWRGLPIGESRNMCIHESQSLLFEKQVFYSKPFCEFYGR